MDERCGVSSKKGYKNTKRSSKNRTGYFRKKSIKVWSGNRSIEYNRWGIVIDNLTF